MTPEEILAEARKLHDATGCTCDRKYLKSCRLFADAIFEAADKIRKREDKDQ